MNAALKSTRQFPRIEPNHSTIGPHYLKQMRLMRLARRIENAGIRFDIAKGEEMLAAALQTAGTSSEALQEVMGLNSYEYKQALQGWLPDAERVRIQGIVNKRDKQFAALIGEAGEGKTKKMAAWFWETKGAPYLEYEKGTERPQFNSNCLGGYLKHERTKGTDVGDAAAHLLNMRAALKRASFLQAYLAFAYHDMGKVHGGFRPFGTVGERWSSSGSISAYGDKWSLNLQNIPGKSIEAQYLLRNGKVLKIQLIAPLRSLFLPPEGASWLKFDYDSQEARLLAIFSGDEYFADMIARKVKLHAQNALDWFRPEVPLPDTYAEFMRFKNMENEAEIAALAPADKEMHARVGAAYDAAKTFMYAVAYQHVRGELGADKYPAILTTCKKYFPEWGEEFISEVVRRYFKTHPAILENYQRAIRKEVLETSRATHPLFGGRLYVEPPLVDPITGHLKTSARGINQCQNYYMQSGGFAIYGNALIALENKFDWINQGILMQLHDEAGVWCPKGEEKHWAAIVMAEMAAPWEFRGKQYSLPADVKMGPSWGQLSKLK